MPEIIGTSKNISGFEPRTVPGCLLWLDGADSNTISIQYGGVWIWYDKSGGNRNFGAFNTGAVVSYSNNGITLPGTSGLSNAFLAYTASTAFDLTNFTFFIVAKSNSATISNQTVFGARGTSAVYNTTEGFGFYMDSNTAYRFYTTAAISVSEGIGVPSLFSFQSGSTVVNQWFNGSPALTNGVTGLSARVSNGLGFAIGAEWQGTGYGNIVATATVYEVLVYNNVLTTTQRQTVEGYLAQKWGLASASFVPTSIGGCTTWYDMADPSKWQTSNAFMSNILDKSGSGNHLLISGIANSCNSPVLGSINGLPAMMFGYTNQSNSNSVSLAYTTNSIMAGPQTIFCVAMYTGYPAVAATAGYAMWFIDNASGQRQCFMNNTGSTTTFNSNTLTYFEANSATYYAMPALQTRGSNIPFLIECSYTTSGSTLVYGNGVASPGSATSTSTTNSQCFIGGGNGGAQAINGCIGEFITYNFQLTTAQRQLVEAYLMTKWGIDPTASLISNATTPTTIYGVSIANQSLVPIQSSNYTSNTAFAGLQPFSRVFQPLDVSGCVLWLDAADGSSVNSGSITYGGTVTSWKDKSGFNNNATASGSPIWSNNSIGQRPSMYMSNVPRFLGAFSPALVPTAGLSVFAVAYSQQTSGLTHDQRLVSMTSNTSTTNDYSAPSGIMAFDIQTNNLTSYYNSQIISNALSANQQFVGSMVVTNSNINGWLTGTPFTTTNTTVSSNLAINSAAYGIGGDAWTSGAEVWYGCIGEVLVYSNALSVPQRQQVEGYLAWKWGLQANLPTTHPYYIIPPSTQAGDIYKKFVIVVLDPTVGISGSTWTPTLGGALSSSYPGWASSAGNNWTLVNSPTLVSTGPSVALSLSAASSQYITDTTGVAVMAAFTIDIWIRPAGLSNACIIGDTSTSTGYSYTLLYLSSNGGIYSGPYYYAGNASGSLGMGVGSYTSNQWYNIVITNTGGTIALGLAASSNSSLVSYVNGVQTNSAYYCRNTPPAAERLWIGYPTSYFPGATTGYFNGQIGGFKQYSVALSPAQVQQNYNAWAWRFGMPISSTPFSFPGGMVFHLDTGNKQSYPGSGTTWTDLVAGATMTLNNGPTYSNAYGGYINFTAASSHYASTGTSLQSVPSWSVEVWHYYTNTSTGTSPAIVTQIWPSAGSVQYQLGAQASGTGAAQVGAAFFTGSAWVSGATYAFTRSNVWVHIVGTYDGANLRTFINGNIVTTTAATAVAPYNTAGFNLMKRWDNADYWGGGLATVRIYSKALTTIEVGSIFNATRTRFGV